MVFLILDTFSKILILLSLILVVISAGLSLVVFWPEPEAEDFSLSISDKSKQEAAEFFNISGQAAEKQQPQKAVLMFVGDIMLSRRVGMKTTKQGDWQWPFLLISHYLASADLAFGNLESMISDQGRNVGSIYSFRADPRMLEGLTGAGFDVLMLANNHVGDWTRLAFEDTMARLTDRGVDYCGAGWDFDLAHQAVVREAGAAKIGFLCYTDLAPVHMKAATAKSGIAWMELGQLKDDIIAARAKADIIIVSMHTGYEYKEHPNKYQRDFARAAIDAGADLVVGHHPHVIQDLETYHNGWIAYSLGNFIFDQDFSEETMHGWLLRVTIHDKEIISVEPIDIYINKDFQPALKG